jgi:heme/copper-type cytochrome/quinol oxidase subunit 2
MRSIFGALFGLIIGSFVSVLLNLKNSQFGEAIKTILKDPFYLAIIFLFAIFGWIIGMITSKKSQATNSSNEKDKNENTTYISIDWVGITLLVLIILGIMVAYGIDARLAFVFILLNEAIFLIIKYNSLNFKIFIKSTSKKAVSEDKKNNKQAG